MWSGHRGVHRVAGSESTVEAEDGLRSRIESVTLAPSSGERLNSAAGHPYRRVVGTLHGIVDGREDVQGLTGSVRYRTQFEMFVPADSPSSLVLVEVENRGNPILPGNFDDLPQIPPAGPPLTASSGSRRRGSGHGSGRYRARLSAARPTARAARDGRLSV